jgi:tetrapyrrole methylase family protein/MazG family protein
MKIDDLIELVKTLRRKCPWDREQTLGSVKNNIIEEAYELVEAIEQDKTTGIEEEIGDFLFLSVFIACIFQEEKNVAFTTVIEKTIDKYRRKHPHVFEQKELKDQDEVLKFWQQSKKDVFSGISRALPALLAARIIQERAARLGFDWESHEGPREKITEELGELGQAADTKSRFEEFGDLLFACVNLARHLKIDPEDALKSANTKFVERFRKIERELAKQGKKIEDVGLEEMDHIWENIKHEDDQRS